MEATIKLFRAVPIKTRDSKFDYELVKKTARLGFIFSPVVVANYSNYDELIRIVEKVVGLSSNQMNSSFHKSWAKIKEADLEQLVVGQIAHYLTTYGKEHPELYLFEKEIQWGVSDLADKVSNLEDIEIGRVQDADYVYIPNEVLDIPGLDMDVIKLVVIKGYTKDELKVKLLLLLESGIALEEETIQAVLEVAMFAGIDDIDVERIKNKEVKVALYDFLGLFPENPVEFLRYVIFKSTGQTLLIKSPELIQSLRNSNNLNIVKLFNDYEKKYGLEKLAEIFYRFRPLFLSLRTNGRMKTVVNRIRKLALKYHKPLPEDFLNSITAKIKNGERVSEVKLEEELSRVSIFRKIRLLSALQYRLHYSNRKDEI